MAMFTTDLVAKLHRMELAKALEKVAALASVHDEEPEAAGVEYRRLRTLEELPAMVAGLAREIGAAGSPLALALAAGVTARVVLNEGVALLDFTLPGKKVTTSTGGVVRSKAAFNYFDGGVAIAPMSLKQHVLHKYPESEAAKVLKDYDAKENNSKIGGFDAVKRDPVLSKLITRTEKV